MRVKALTSFTDFIDGQPRSFSEGDETEMPAGFDWVTAGLAVAIEAEAEESTAKPATVKPKAAKKSK